MQTLVIAPAVHKATGKFVYYYNLSVFNHIVNVAFHNAVGAYSLIYMVGYRYIFGIVKVFYA